MPPLPTHLLFRALRYHKFCFTRLSLSFSTSNKNIFRKILISIPIAILTACQTLNQDISTLAVMREAITKEPQGNYFIGRRMYKNDYKIWGWIRKPGHPWNTAKLVMLNEQKHLAPDRQQNDLGSDNNYEYRLEGYFTDQLVYEPASDNFYPEFILLKATLLSTSPLNIYRFKEQLNPAYRLLLPPNI